MKYEMKILLALTKEAKAGRFTTYESVSEAVEGWASSNRTSLTTYLLGEFRTTDELYNSGEVIKRRKVVYFFGSDIHVCEAVLEELASHLVKRLSLANRPTFTC